MIKLYHKAPFTLSDSANWYGQNLKEQGRDLVGELIYTIVKKESRQRTAMQNSNMMVLLF